MKFLMKLLDPRGLKLWIVLLAMILNLALTLVLFMAVDSVLMQRGGEMNGLDTTLMLGEFLITILIGFGIALLANDQRGLTYGVYGAIPSFVAIVIIMFRSGLLAVMVGAMALLGGYNGGMIGARINFNRQK